VTTQTADKAYGPNDRQECGSRAAKIRHRAKGETCRVCWPDGGPGPVTVEAAR
jgi:hypothetical protein